MLKRLRSPSGMGTDSRGDESPAARRRRLSGDVERTAQLVADSRHFNELPLEIRRSIVEHLVDPKDTVGTLKTLGRFSSVDHKAKDAVDVYLHDSDHLENLNFALLSYVDDLDHLATEPHGWRPESARMAHLKAEANLLPLQSAAGRNHNVSSILRYKGIDFDPEAVRNVIGNLDHLEPQVRSKVVRHVRDHNDSELLVDLVCKADSLSPAERKTLVADSISIDDADIQARALAGWADKTHLLDETSQRLILDALPKDAGCGKALADFAAHAEKLLPENRSRLVADVVKLEPQDAYRSKALSNLARHADVLDAQDRSVVADQVLADLAPSQDIALDPHQSWDSLPAFSRLEAIHHLAASHELAPDRKEAVLVSVRQTLELLPHGDDGEGDGVRAQFVDHLAPDERKLFMDRTILEDDAVLHHKVLLGLTARVNSLEPDEREAYIMCIKRLCPTDQDGKKAVSHAIENNFLVFNKDDRSFLVTRQIESMHPDRSYVGPAMAQLSRQAQFFTRTETDSMVTAAATLSNAYARELPTANRAVNASLRSVAGHVVRGVNTWVQAALTNPGPKLTSADDETQVSRRSDRPTEDRDRRRRDSSNVR